MNKDLVSIGDVYGKMLNTFKYTNNLEEAAAKPAFGEFKKTDGGPTEEGGYHDALDDDKGKKPIKAKKKKNKVVKDEDEESENNSRIHKESKKSAGKTLNNFMSKSVFDKLYNKVLRENFGQEEDALGLGDATPDSEVDEFGGEDDFSDEEGGDDSVTFTLSRDVAQQLVDVLQGVLGGEEDLGDEEGLDFGDEGDDEFGGDDEFNFEEDEETQGTKELGNKSVSTFQGPTKSNKVTNKVAPKGGKASSSVTDNTNTTEGAPPITALQGKGNQVPGSKIKVGDFFK
jgi:hypothetical protein